jgi:hypothetical protein
MKQNLSIIVIILVPYCILTIGGKEVSCIKGGGNTRRVLKNHQANNTVQVCTYCIMYIFYHFGDYDIE